MAAKMRGMTLFMLPSILQSLWYELSLGACLVSVLPRGVCTPSSRRIYPPEQALLFLVCSCFFKAEALVERGYLLLVTLKSVRTQIVSCRAFVRMDEPAENVTADQPGADDLQVCAERPANVQARPFHAELRDQRPRSLISREASRNSSSVNAKTCAVAGPPANRPFSGMMTRL